MTDLHTDIIFGDKYEDVVTGLQGTATAITHYQFACERITLEFLKDGELKYESFDAPRMRHIKTGAVATTTRTGGPGGREARQHQPGVR